MAQKNIPDLTNKPTPISSDKMEIYDVAANSNKHVTIGSMITALLGVIPGGGILTAMLANASVTASKLATGATYNAVAADQSTTSSSYADLSTVGPSVTVTVGANGLALVLWGAGIYNVAANKYVGVAVSGASTVAAADADAIRNDIAAFQGTQHSAKLFTGLTPGSTTFTLKYRTASGTANFFARNLTVIPL